MKENIKHESSGGKTSVGSRNFEPIYASCQKSVLFPLFINTVTFLPYLEFLISKFDFQLHAKEFVTFLEYSATRDRSARVSASYILNP